MNKPKTPLSFKGFYSEILADTSLDLTFKDLRLLASGLAALSAAQERPLNGQELFAVKSLIAYAAHTKNTDEEKIESILNAKFDVPDTSALPARRYEEIVEYLVDLELVNFFN